MRILKLYAVLGPLLLGPLAYFLWWDRLGHDHRLAVAAVFLPVVFAYLVPGIGTNVLRLWEIRVGPLVGRFRPQHGFVFGSASALLAFLAFPAVSATSSLAGAVRAAFVLGSLLGFWNWFYDIVAIRAGVLRVYNRPYAEGRGPEAIATDYAPAFFGVFGAAYGVQLHLLDQRVRLAEVSAPVWPLVAASMAAVFAPVVAHALLSRWRHGTWGLRPCAAPVSRESGWPV